MSKLLKGFVGCSFDVQTETVKVTYKIVDASFTSPFGFVERFNYEITSVKYWASEVDNWIEFGKDLGKFEPIIKRMVEDDL